MTRSEFERALATRPTLASDLIQHLVHRVRPRARTVQGPASVDVYGRRVGLFEALAVDVAGAATTTKG